MKLGAMKKTDGGKPKRRAEFSLLRGRAGKKEVWYLFIVQLKSISNFSERQEWKRKPVT